jgi:hypothetical protein
MSGATMRSTAHESTLIASLYVANGFQQPAQRASHLAMGPQPKTGIYTLKVELLSFFGTFGNKANSVQTLGF